MRETKSTKEMNGAELLELVENDFVPDQEEVRQIIAIYDEFRVNGHKTSIYDGIIRAYMLGKINGRAENKAE